jgi:hypothetical protein
MSGSSQGTRTLFARNYGRTGDAGRASDRAYCCAFGFLIDLPFEQPHERRLHRSERAHLLGNAIDGIVWHGENGRRVHLRAAFLFITH